MIFEKAHFNPRKQLDGKTVDQYIIELYKLADTCDYGNLKDEDIRNRLVVGIRDASLSQQLHLDTELIPDKEREAVGGQQKELKGGAEGGTNLEELLDELRFHKHKGCHLHKGRGSKAKSRYHSQKVIAPHYVHYPLRPIPLQQDANWYIECT